MGNPKLRFKLSPELADGDHWIIADTPSEVCEAVNSWCENLPYYGVGESFSVEVVEMSQKEVDALPEL